MTDSLSWHRRLDGVIEACWLAALLLAPVAVAPEHAFPFPHPKAAVVAAFALLGLAAWALKALTGGRPFHPLPTGAATAGAIRRLLLGLAVTALSIGLGATLAIAPRLAWLGAGTRAMGAVTQLSILVLTLLVVGHLRRREQIVRMIEIVVLTSLPICLFAVLQAFGGDPIFRPQSPRPVSLAGNANILARFLLPTIFVTLGLLLERSASSARSALHSSLRQGLLVGLLGLQVWTLLVTGSRGALLGLAVGAATLAWALWTMRRAAPGPILGSGERGLLVVACLAALAFAALGWRHTTTRPGAPLTRGVGTLVDASSRTARVRLTLWRDAAAAYTASQPLVGAIGPDRLHPARRWIGHGPGLSGPALVRAASPELSRLEPNKTADQAHNQVWDLLLTRGVLGLFGWVVLQGALIELFFAALGLIRGPTDTVWLWGCLASGALTGWTTTHLVGLGPGLTVPLAVAGGLLGVAGFALVRSARSAGAPLAKTAPLAALIAAALTARMVAGQFGIETVTDSLVLALLAALLVPTALGDTTRELVENPRSILPAAAAALALSLVWTFAIARHGALAAPIGRPHGSLAIAWLTGATLLSASLLTSRRSLRQVPPAALATLATGVAWHWLVSRQLGSEVAGGTLHWAEALAQHEIALVSAFLVGLAGGAVLIGARSLALPGLPSSRGSVGRRLPVILAVTAVATSVLYIGVLRPLTAGFLQRAGQRARSAGAQAPALSLTAAAARRAGDPAQAATIEAAIERGLGQVAKQDASREAHFDRAEAALRRALDTAPFNSDLVGNLGLIDLERQRHVEEGRRRELAARAATHFAAALALRPVGGPWERNLEAARVLGSGVAENPAPTE